MKQGLSVEVFTERFLAPWNAHDIPAILAALPENFVWQFATGNAPHGSVYRGKTEVAALLARTFAAIPDIRYVPVALHEGENHLVMELRVTGNKVSIDANGSAVTNEKLDFQACDVVLFAKDAQKNDIVIEKRSYRKVVT
jgi:ketosteroid isomerase-like protein